MIDGTSVRQNAAATGPTTPPLPPARLTPPRTIAATPRGGATHTSGSTGAMPPAPAGTPWETNTPVPSAWYSTGDPPPGVRMISSATPPHTNDMARVTTMSGTPVSTISPPLIVPRSTPTNM